MKTTILSLLLLATLIIARGQEVSTFIASDDEELHYTKYGDSPIVVFLYGDPGYAVNAIKTWADSLSSDFQCILFDQRGTGLSSDVKLDTSTINLHRAVRDLDDLRNHLNEDKLILCGISWGGMLAQVYAPYFPDNTSKIVLVSTLGPNLSIMQAFRDNMNMRRFPNERDSLEYWQNQPMFSCDNPSNSKVNVEIEKAAIQIVISEHLDAVDLLDVTRLLNCMTEDHVEMPANMSRLVGKQAYGEYFSSWIGFFKSLKQKEMSFVPDEFVVTGDWAFQIGTYSTKFTLPDDSLIEDTGNYVWIFNKGHDGTCGMGKNNFKFYPTNTKYGIVMKNLLITVRQ